MKPEDIAKPNTEHAHQCALFCWIKQQIRIFPEFEWIYAIPNGGQRNAIVAARLKNEGVKSGVSDICLPFSRRGYHSFYVEMKKPGAGNRESPAQKAFGKHLADNGFLYACCDHWEKARDAIRWYMEDD